MPAVVDGDKNTNNEDGIEIYLKNPTYEGSSKKTGLTSSVAYDTVELSPQTVEEDGKTYDVPDRHWEVKGTYMF